MDEQDLAELGVAAHPRGAVTYELNGIDELAKDIAFTQREVAKRVAREMFEKHYPLIGRPNVGNMTAEKLDQHGIDMGADWKVTVIFQASARRGGANPFREQ